MKKNCNVGTDRVCVYVESHVNSSVIGKTILAIVSIIAWSGYLFFAASTPGTEMKTYAIPLIILFVVLVFGLGRYSAWNFWGKEFLRINTRSVSFSRSYGIIETKETIIKFNGLSYNYEKINTHKNVAYGRIHLYDYDENNNPQQIFETSILIAETDVQQIFEKVDELFANEFMEDKGLNSIILN